MSTQTAVEPRLPAAAFPPRSILAAVDFSECSRAGLELARILAGRFSCRVEAVHVDAGPPASLCEGCDTPAGQEAQRNYNKNLNYRLEGFVGKLRGGTCRVMDGKPFEIIPRLAAGGAADMIVMGTHGHAGISHFTQGSLAENTVHRSRVPVLTARFMPPPGWPSRILAPLKWTHYADQALLAARDWAREFKANLVALHVFEDSEPGAPDAEALRKHVQRLLGEKGPLPGWIFRSGRPCEEILRSAEGGRYDLIVLAAHARDFWHDTLLGTTAERILRHSGVPVLSIPSRRHPLCLGTYAESPHGEVEP